METLKAIWSFRGFVFGSVKREFHARYQHSLFGAIWAIVNPLAMILVYTTIFSSVMKAKLPGSSDEYAYSIYLCSGLLTWGLFSEIVSRGQTVFIDNANLLKKVSFPSIALPIIVVLNALLNFAIIFSLFILFLLFNGSLPGWVTFSMIPVLIIQIIFSTGLGVALGILNVFFRDVGHLFGVVLQFWFWFTPVVYTSSILPGELRSLLQFNPMYPLVVAYQGIFVQGQEPEWFSLIYPLIFGTLLCLLTLRIFRQHAGEMVDEL